MIFEILEQLESITLIEKSAKLKLDWPLDPKLKSAP